MSTYAIGDIQGCFTELEALLDIIDFNHDEDKLWFTGDLVNRGPESLEVLRFVKALGDRAITVLGNHDLHLLAVFNNKVESKPKDTLETILDAPDCHELCEWLRHQPLLHHDPILGYTLIHAGFPPQWDLDDAQIHAREVEKVLQSNGYITFLSKMYRNHPNQWSDSLESWERIRFITNAFTRIRFCDAEGHLDLKNKGKPGEQDEGFMEWFKIPERKSKGYKLIIGHWAAIIGEANEKNIYALDTGCIWGNSLTALRLEDEHLFSVVCKGIPFEKA